MRHFEGASRALTQDVGRIVNAGQRSLQVFRTEVVDELQLRLLVALQLARRDDPAERVQLLAQKARQIAVELLSRDDDILIVQIDAHIYLILTIIYVRAKRTVGLCFDGYCCQHTADDE